MEIKERREFQRYLLYKQVKVAVGDGKESVDCQLRDICFKGAQIIISRRIEKDTYKNLRITLSKDCSVEATCWVAWQKIIDGHNVYGLYFSKISDDDKEKISQFARRYCAGQIKKEWRRGIKEENKKGGENMEGEKFSDKRVFERFPARFNLRYIDLFSNQEGRGWTNDISAKGLGITLNGQLSNSAPIEMWVEVPGRQEPHYLRGEVAWCEKGGRENFRVGVNLERANLMGMSGLLAAR
ncbi:MAG: PilZ domain-containing protein [Candidatus Omnitrophota bacterium]